MRERPIIMTPENAQKVHDGTKTQTRRIVKDVGACPYGLVGDRLWVREAWAMREDVEASTPKAIHYLRYKGQGGDLSMEWHHYGKWRPSLHMPRWGCRTVVEIAEIRVERLNEISEEDAIAEGIEYHNGMGVGHAGYRHSQQHGYVYPTAVEAYKVLWESIHGAGAWDQNPWVWVITFRRLRC